MSPTNKNSIKRPLQNFSWKK